MMSGGLGKIGFAPLIPPAAEVGLRRDESVLFHLEKTIGGDGKGGIKVERPPHTRPWKGFHLVFAIVYNSVGLELRTSHNH